MTGTSTLERPATASRSGREATVPVRLSVFQQIMTAILVIGPLIGVAVAVFSFFGRGVSAFDLVLAVVFYAVVGHGVTAGFHRMLTHRGFKANRWVKVALLVAGSMAFEGDVTSWVANHR